MPVESPSALHPPIVLKGGPGFARLTDAQSLELCRVPGCGRPGALRGDPELPRFTLHVGAVSGRVIPPHR